MGKGDRSTARGKRYRGSYGKARPHSVVKTTPATKAVSKTAGRGTRKPAARKRAS